MLWWVLPARENDDFEYFGRYDTLTSGPVLLDGEDLKSIE